MHRSKRALRAGQAAPDRLHKDEAPNRREGGSEDHKNKQNRLKCAAAHAADQGVEAPRCCICRPCSHCTGGAFGAFGSAGLADFGDQPFGDLADLGDQPFSEVDVDKVLRDMGWGELAAMESLDLGLFVLTDAQRKSFTTLVARLALFGLQLHRLDDGRLLVTLASQARLFADYAAAANFADELEVQK